MQEGRVRTELNYGTEQLVLGSWCGDVTLKEVRESGKQESHPLVITGPLPSDSCHGDCLDIIEGSLWMDVFYLEAQDPLRSWAYSECCRLLGRKCDFAIQQQLEAPA